MLKKLKSGKKEYKEKFIEANLRLVLSIVKKFNNRGENVNDIFQVGVVGLIKAIDNFDITQPVQFSTYAVPMIIGEIKRYLRDNNSVRIARSIKDLAYKLSKEREYYISIHGIEPCSKVLCERLNITEYELSLAQNSLKDTVSMFEPIYNDGGDVIYLCDQLEDKSNNLYSIEEKLGVKEALNRLKDKEKYIVESRFIYGKTQMELSLELGISQAQISRLEHSGIENIKKMIL